MERILRKLTGIFLAVIMTLSMGINVFAVTGSTVAADGVYTSTVMAYKYKYGKLDDTYYGTLNVVVSDGEISGLYILNRITTENRFRMPALSFIQKTGPKFRLRNPGMIMFRQELPPEAVKK